MRRKRRGLGPAGLAALLLPGGLAVRCEEILQEALLAVVRMWGEVESPEGYLQRRLYVSIVIRLCFTA